VFSAEKMGRKSIGCGCLLVFVSVDYGSAFSAVGEVAFSAFFHVD